ncbi:UNVERIFIED_CONTAM: hypothetical protein ODX46_09300, partial [Salmonella enterica subsp. enterica serovar Enteritidis]
IGNAVLSHGRDNVFSGRDSVVGKLLFMETANLRVIEDECIGAGQRIHPRARLGEIGFDCLDFRMHPPQQSGVCRVLIDPNDLDIRVRFQPGVVILTNKSCSAFYDNPSCLMLMRMIISVG